MIPLHFKIHSNKVGWLSRCISITSISLSHIMLPNSLLPRTRQSTAPRNHTPYLASTPQQHSALLTLVLLVEKSKTPSQNAGQ
jgi:hypothetical protein